MRMLQEPGDAERVHEVLRSVMEREGIPREPSEPSALTRWLADKLGSLFEGWGGNSDILVVALILLSLAFVIALVVAAVRGRAGRWRSRGSHREIHIDEYRDRLGKLRRTIDKGFHKPGDFAESSGGIRFRMPPPAVIWVAFLKTLSWPRCKEDYAAVRHRKTATSSRSPS